MNDNTEAAAVGRKSAAFLAIVLGLLAPRLLLSQPPERLTVDVGECVKLESPGERLDCYEEQVQRAQTKPPAPTAGPAPALPPAAAQSDPPAAASSPPAAAPSRAPAAQSERPATAPSQRAAAPNQAPAAAAGGRVARGENARSSGGAAGGNGKITAAISALRPTVPNAWLITLDNGQVWRQDYPEPYALRVGQRVEIVTTGRLSGPRLTGAGMQGSIQVERVE